MRCQESPPSCGSEIKEWKRVVKKLPRGERYFQSLKAYAVGVCLLRTWSA